MTENFLPDAIAVLDVIIVGGGMVGAACAVALSQNGLSVAVIEKQPPTAFQPDSEPDLRVSSVHLGSEQWLKQLGVWPQLETMRLCAYKRLQTFEQPGTVVAFDASDIKQQHLGHIVENNLLQLALWQSFNDKVQVVCPAEVKSISQTADAASLQLDNGQQLTARLIIAADGGNSQLRQLAGIGSAGWQYRQACLVALVSTPYPQQDITWQQFTEQGPRAFLPLAGNRASLVWYDDAAKVKALAALPPETLQQHLLAAFPAQLGDVKVLQTSWFPLARMDAIRYYRGRVVLAGDAAHTINPLAGQGVNLGFADAQLLTQLLVEASKKGHDLAQPALLAQYQRQRKAANLLMMTAMDAFYKGFSSSLPPVRWLRQQGLQLASRAGELKKLVSRYAVGSVG